VGFADTTFCVVFSSPATFLPKTGHYLFVGGAFPEFSSRHYPGFYVLFTAMDAKQQSSL
jgi:hypothetical protein